MPNTHNRRGYQARSEDLADVGLTPDQWQSALHSDRPDWNSGLDQLLASAERQHSDDIYQAAALRKYQARAPGDGCSEVACWLLGAMALAGCMLGVVMGWV